MTNVLNVVFAWKVIFFNELTVFDPFSGRKDSVKNVLLLGFALNRGEGSLFLRTY